MINLNKQFYYKNNRVQQLKGFDYTAQLQSVKKAAEKMGLTSSSISLQIKTLERDLKTTLFERKDRKMILTEDGRLLYKLSIPCIQTLDGMFERFICEKEMKNNREIKIAAHNIVISHLLPKYLLKYKNIFPDIKIEIQNLNINDALKRLLNKEIDFAFYPIKQNLNTTNFKAKKLFFYDPLLIMNKQHPLAKTKEKNITLEDLSKYDLVRIDPKLITLDLFEETVKKYKIGSNIIFENGQWEMLRYFVKNKIGLALVSTMCKDYVEDKDIIGKNLKHHFPTMDYGIITKKGTYIKPYAKNFIELIDKYYFKEN